MALGSLSFILLALALSHGSMEPGGNGDEVPALGPELSSRLDHWAWQPIGEPTLPELETELGDWPLDPLDGFVLASLGRAGLQPAAEADRATWLRRVTFDLTGLPPTPEEVRAFLEDDSADPHAAVVDRLLSSPAHPERQARHWLDLVRFAETKGHEFDYRIPNAFEYRDYVIRAFEADVPHDRFLIEHIAGDLLPDPRRNAGGGDESVVGTGFWQLGSEIHSPVDLENDRAERSADQIDVFSRAFLGLTVACARCHDHKADAISQRDFYALAGYVESSRVRQVRFETDEANRSLAGELVRLDEQHEPDLRRALASDLAAGFAGIDRLFALPLVVPRPSTWSGFQGVEWMVRAACNGGGEPPLRVAAASLARLDLPTRVASASAEERSLYRPTTHQWIVDGPGFGPVPRSAGSLRWNGGRVIGNEAFDVARYDTLWDRLERHPESELAQAGLTWDASGRTLHTPTFQLGEGRLFALVRGGADVHASLEGHRLVQGPLHAAGKRTWSASRLARWLEIDLRDYAGMSVHLEFTPLGGEDFALVELIEAEEAPADRTLAMPTAADLVEAARSLTRVPDPAHAARVEWMLRWRAIGEPGSGAARPLLAEYRGARGLREAQVQVRSRLAPALLDGSPVESDFAVRGNPHTPEGRVPRRFLMALDPTLSEAPGSGRLELARRLVHPGNPLPARVWVNRIWQQFFGRGLVSTVDDFGAMGEAPSHPALLDHLAQRFVRGGWSTRELLRTICLSRTYRMASTEDAAGREQDPLNALLHRGPLRRLDAESLRDALLAFTGGLDPERFGPSVPLHLTPFLEGRGRPGSSGPLDGDGRRSVYQVVRRNFPQPFLAVFDAPTPSTTRGRRSVSNVPAQTLTLLNDPFVLDQCRRLAQRLLDSGEPRDAQLDGLLLAAYGRPPLEGERERLALFLDGHGGDPEEAWSDLVQALVLSREFRFLR